MRKQAAVVSAAIEFGLKSKQAASLGTFEYAMGLLALLKSTQALVKYLEGANESEKE